jgi:pSer/pThr/pTyr-binding forkhead associated (FHA) protein
VVKAGPDAGRRLDLEEDTAIGRDSHCRVALNDEYVSRQHARVKLEAGQFFIYDVGSSGGTFVNGSQIQRLMLYDGAEIRVGNTTMEFKKTTPVARS